MLTIISQERSASAELLRALATGRGRFRNRDLSVSWGRQSGSAINGGPKVSNYDQLGKFREAGLSTPDFTRVEPTTDRDLWIGRKDSHTRGRDIKFPRQTRGFRESDYYVKLIPLPSEEWRLTVAFGKTIARGKKIPGPNGSPTELIRNRSHNWVLDHRVDPPKGLRDAAKRACASLGYDFGAVDIIAKDGTFYVLEVNKAPGLDNYTAEAYVKAFENHG